MAHHGIVTEAGEPAKAFGRVEFVMRDGPVTLSQIVQDNQGNFKAVIAEGTVESNPVETFGAYGWVRIPGFQGFCKNVLLRHFNHHMAISRSKVGNVLWEAFGNYLGFDRVFAPGNQSGSWSPDLPFRAD